MAAIADVSALWASTLEPFYDIIREGRESIYSAESSLAFTLLQDDKYCGKIRPCVLINDDPSHPLVCVMATFNGAEYRSLPFLIRNFLVPVYPTKVAGCNVLEYIRTEPQWPVSRSKRGVQKPQWIIARAFVPRKKKQDLRRWINGRSDTHYLDNEEFDRLDEICHEQFRIWDEDLSEDERGQATQQFNAHVANLKKGNKRWLQLQRGDYYHASKFQAKSMIVKGPTTDTCTIHDIAEEPEPMEVDSMDVDPATPTAQAPPTSGNSARKASLMAQAMQIGLHALTGKKRASSLH